MYFSPLLFISLYVGLLISACTYPIKYRLNDRDIVKETAPKPLKVQVAIFSDKREAVEKEKSERKKSGGADVGDYTYDKEFRGPVDQALSEMLVKHLQYAGVFAEVALSRYRADQISAAVLDSLSRQGIDAVMTGEIKNFYGYYDNNSGRQFLYGFGLGMAIGLPLYLAGTSQESTTFGGPFDRTEITTTKTNPIPGAIGSSVGLNLGFYLESLHKRNIERHTQFYARLISTSTQQVLWEDALEVQQKDFRAMPGINTATRKYEVAVASLRDAVNQMVRKLGEAQLSVFNP
jgi:hypothetical protein